MNPSNTLRLTSRNIIPSNEILYLKSDINYTIVHTVDNRKHISGFTLKLLEKRILNTAFLRINKGLLINSNYINEVTKREKEVFVTLQNGEMLPVSRRKTCLLEGIKRAV